MTTAAPHKRVVCHARRHPKKYITISTVAILSVLYVVGDFVSGVVGNLVASVIGPWVGVH